MITLISDEEVLSKMIEDFKLQGFDQIRLPGGTSKDGSFYSGVLVPKYDRLSKKTFFFAVPFNSHFYLDGETNVNKRSNETPEQTGIRELFEETGIMVKNMKKLFVVWEKVVPDTREWMYNELHKKQVFAICEEDYDDSQYFTFKGPNPVNAETLAPICISSDLYIKVIFQGHRPAVREGINKLILKKIEYAYSLMNFSW